MMRLFISDMSTRERNTNASSNWPTFFFVTCIQDFFGISVVEGIAAGCFPLLPDRLAYPEHLPILNREFSLYRKNEEMMPMLVHIIENKLYKDTKEFTDFVRRYEWINLIHEYDRCLEANC